MPAHISLLSLLLSSKPYRNALLRILNQAHGPHNMSVKNLHHIIGNVVATNFITFNDDEIQSDGRGHNKVLHITTKCKNHIIARVLIECYATNHAS